MARIHYWDDVPGEHARKRRDTKWQDVTNWSANQLQLWRMQVIAEAGVQDPRKPIPSEGKFESLALEWLEQNLPRYKRSFRRTVAMFAYRCLIPAFGAMPIEEITGPVVIRVIRSTLASYPAARCKYLCMIFSLPCP